MDDVAEILLDGGVALLPTDTVYGLLARPDIPAAVARIFALKNRPAEKNLPIFVANASQLAALGVKIDHRVAHLLESRFMPGPLTLVLGLERARTPVWLQGRSEVAVRMPDDDFLLALLKKTGPLLATSANASGKETPAEIAPIKAQLAGVPDVAIDAGPRKGAPSTLIDCQTTPFTVLRRGALSAAALAEVLEI